MFDGYDELSDTSLLHDEIADNLQNYIITSRPYGYRKSDFDVNEVFETIGFTDENVTAYIDKFFEEQSHKTNLQNFLKQNINIRHIAYIPLMLEMICSLWREKAKSNQSFLSPMTMTELYSEVVKNMLSKYARRKKYEEVYKRKYKKGILTYLGQIAFEALKKQTIIIDGKILEEVIETIKIDDEDDFLEKNIFYTGFLKSDNKSEDPWSNSYEFPHLTFQEYFSALYVSKLPKEQISEVIREYKFYPYMQVFFSFLGGLIGDKKWFLEELEKEPKDMVGFYEVMLFINCFNNIKKTDIDKDRINNINDVLIKWIRILLIKGEIEKIEIFLKKLEIVTHLFNKKIINLLLKIIEDNIIKDNIKTKIIFLLRVIPVYDDLINDLIGMLQNKNIQLFTRANLAISLVNLSINHDKAMNILVSIIEDKNFYFWVRRDISKKIASLFSTTYFTSKFKNSFNNILIEFISDKNVRLDIRLSVGKDLALICKYDDKSINSLINLIQETDDSYNTIIYKSDIINFLISIDKNTQNFKQIIEKPETIYETDWQDDIKTRDILIREAYFNLTNKISSIEDIPENKCIESLIDIIKYRKIMTREAIASIYLYLAFIGKHSDRVIDRIIKIIEDRNINLKIKLVVINSLTSIDRDDDKLIQSLMRIIENRNIESIIRERAVICLASKGKSNNKIINCLVVAIRTIRKTIHINSKYSRSIDIDERSIFLGNNELGKKMAKLTYNKHVFLKEMMEFFPVEFMKYSSVEMLFELYSNYDIHLDMIMENIYYNKLPLYIKDNKLYTIYQNKKIKTKRDVSLKDIENVKKKMDLII